MPAWMKSLLIGDSIDFKIQIQSSKNEIDALFPAHINWYLYVCEQCSRRTMIQCWITESTVEHIVINHLDLLLFLIIMPYIKTESPLIFFFFSSFHMQPGIIAGDEVKHILKPIMSICWICCFVASVSTIFNYFFLFKECFYNLILPASFHFFHFDFHVLFEICYLYAFLVCMLRLVMNLWNCLFLSLGFTLLAYFLPSLTFCNIKSVLHLVES